MKEDLFESQVILKKWNKEVKKLTSSILIKSYYSHTLDGYH